MDRPVEKPEIIKCLHKIYYCFDLVNFNQEQYDEKISFKKGQEHAENRMGEIAVNFKDFYLAICKEHDFVSNDIILEQLKKLKEDYENKDLKRPWLIKSLHPP